jgi:hypothetical protein
MGKNSFMDDKKRTSGLHDHKIKKGVLLTPLNDALGSSLKLNSWAKERMPDYLWLGLILLKYKRNEGLKRAGQILFEISKSFDMLEQPTLSQIFELPDHDQEMVYKIIIKHIGKATLNPLTIIYRRKHHQIFNDYFSISHYTVAKRIELLSKAVEVFSPHQSNEATDLRFLIMSFLIFKGKLIFTEDANGAITAFKEYPNTDHNDEKMRWYRPAIRSAEGAMGGIINKRVSIFSNNFWKELGMITHCNPMAIEYPKNQENYDTFLIDCQNALEYVFISNKDQSLLNEKFSVVIGLISFALKVFAEINNNTLGDGILGRQGLRTIIESYIMLKYLIKNETEHPDIWREYKLYGISKYKLILLKAREYDFLDTTSHLSIPVIDVLVNEFMYEEFLNVDLKYFDNQNIREKSIDVKEKQLYDLFYDYDSNFSHALWGAIRESAMLYCNNAAHQYHSIPDIYAKQLLPDVKSDCLKVIKKLFLVFNELYDLPASFLEKYIAV